MNRNGDLRRVGSRDPVDYLFKKQAEPSMSKTQPQLSLDNPALPSSLSAADYYPSKLRAEPTGSDSRRMYPLYAQDDQQRVYV